jgi:hypothetical protein
MSDVPRWLDALVDVVAKAMTSFDVSGPLGLRYREEKGQWEVLVYPLPVELVGGAQDGGIVAPSFSLDLQEMRSAFQRVDDFAWDAHGLSPEDSPCLSVEGKFAEQEVWLRVLAFAPEDEEPGMKFDTNRAP